MKDKIIGITVGIRFSKSFRIPDVSGQIIDDILYNEDSPFDAEYFPRVQETSNRERTLYNPRTSDYLRINTDDLIMGVRVDNNFDQKYKWIKEDVFKYLKERLFTKFGIKNIQRIGVIFTHKIEKNRKLGDSINLLTADNIKGVENINISFSKKNSAQEALFRKGVNDYRNAIYNFSEMEDGLLVGLDFQYYYLPIIEDLRECFSEKVFEDALSFLETNFYTWINSYEKVEGK